MSYKRHIVTDSIILNVGVSREIDRSFTFISKEVGVNRTVAFGACKYKSRYCSTIQPFVKLKLYLYKNPKTEYFELKDISEPESSEFIKNDIRKIYIAAFFSEIIQKTYINPEEYKKFFYLMQYSLELLHNGDALKNALLFFICKFLYLSGVNPALESCLKCQNSSPDYFYDFIRGGVFCSKCAANFNNRISAESVKIFRDFLKLKYSELKNVTVDSRKFDEILRILVKILSNLFDAKLSTLDNIINLRDV
ncbi:MAG TPA: DNA repair protein RecO [Spirochaetota bacterium]|jgi:DNA repair protein RecO|nr:MAG: DNA repair protein RecO [Spirochaetes bacterium ADurb.Bin133]HNZ25765.1 DNA repair protein RecO [Spirochaetota bacterium]HOF00095.1 DNA repair protein RecO [Spirochaetota bacterium]HOS31875.1 DNA repair protein RecO [Spirochaetota bacterium]HOS54462.1 DNA repair protein RecO [Spirochaetota bacterium]